MKPRHRLSPALLAQVSSQFGALSHDQALAGGLTRHSISRLVDDGDWVRLGRGGTPRRVNATDTLLDCLDDSTADEALTLVSQALHLRLTSRSYLSRRVALRARQPHRSLVLDLVGGAQVGIGSPLEARYLRDVVRAHGPPEGQRQVVVVGDHPSDVWLEDYRTIIQLDGRAYHHGAAALRDLELDAAASAAGILTIRLATQQVVRPQACATAARIGQLLQTRGWPGATGVRCPQCRDGHAIPLRS